MRSNAIKHWILFALGGLSWCGSIIASELPPNEVEKGISFHTVTNRVQLATSFDIDRDRVAISEYLVSEKLDGIRARWTGKALVSRKGNVIHSPTWFVKNWPDQVLDGELWIARGKYQQTASVVLRDTPDKRWRRVRFMVFDMPELAQPFHLRAQAISRLATKIKSPTLAAISQVTLNDHDALESELSRIVDLGGEGLMLHHRDALYYNGRSKHLLKIKRHQDAEARVVAHLPGKGKYEQVMGALLVEMPNGLQFKLGSGFTDKQRRDPPKIGSWITFKHYGSTTNGVPRFASFMRIRPIKDVNDR